jgi:hypothetical protein
MYRDRQVCGVCCVFCYFRTFPHVETIFTDKIHMITDDYGNNHRSRAKPANTSGITQLVGSVQTHLLLSLLCGFWLHAQSIPFYSIEVYIRINGRCYSRH